jgi:hypothetical protein
MPPGISLDLAGISYVYSVDGGDSWKLPTTGWPIKYDCNQKPVTAGWTLLEGGESANVIVSVSGGILHIEDKSTAGGTKVKYAKNWNVNPSVGATVLARMKCAVGSGGQAFAGNISVADSLHSDALYLKGNGVIGLLGYGVLVPVNTYDNFHLYRVTIKNEDINVYYDENPKPIIRGQGAFVQAPVGYLQKLLIGSGSSAGTQDIYYDYVYWTTAGAFAPGQQWWNAQYNGDTVGGTITTIAVPFNQYSATLNKIRFNIQDIQGQTHESPVYTVETSEYPIVSSDFDCDGDVDSQDYDLFELCVTGPNIEQTNWACQNRDLDNDNDVDQGDFGIFQCCYSGANNPADPNCVY